MLYRWAMLAFSIQLLAVAVSESRAEELDLSLLVTLIALLLCLGACAWLARALWPERLVRRKRPLPRRSAPVQPGETPAPASVRRRRRVILLYAVTPGQARHEYNIGDSQGSRGSALVRAA